MNDIVSEYLALSETGLGEAFDEVRFAKLLMLRERMTEADQILIEERLEAEAKANGEDGDDITEYELNEQVFVPEGDGEPAQWMRHGDLLDDADERRLKRWSRWCDADGVRYALRMERWMALIEEAKRRSGIGAPIGERSREDIIAHAKAMLTHDEFVEFSQLQWGIDACEHAACRNGRQEAIARDLAAGRYRTINWRLMYDRWLG